MTQADSVHSTPRIDSSSIAASKSLKLLTRRGGSKRRKRAAHWTNEEIALARRMLAEKRTDAEFLERLGRSKSSASARMFQAVPADADRRAAAPRTLSARLCGDPASGQSAIRCAAGSSMKHRRRSHRKRNRQRLASYTKRLKRY